MHAPPPERPSALNGNSRIAWIGLAIAGALAFGVGLFVADAHGVAGVYEWSVLFALGAGFAMALFWGRRKAGWYWPTVALITVVHIVALAVLKWRVFPTGTAAQFGSAPMLRGIIGGDFAVTALIMYIAHGFFDREGVSKTGPTAVAKAIKLGFALLVLAIPIGITLLVMQAHQSKLAALRVAYVQDTAWSANHIMHCLEPKGERGVDWQDVATPSPSKELFEGEWDRRFRIIDKGTVRQVEVATVQGRKLSPEEAELLSGCLGYTPH